MDRREGWWMQCGTNFWRKKNGILIFLFSLFHLLIKEKRGPIFIQWFCNPLLYDWRLSLTLCIYTDPFHYVLFLWLFYFSIFIIYTLSSAHFHSIFLFIYWLRVEHILYLPSSRVGESYYYTLRDIFIYA